MSLAQEIQRCLGILASVVSVPQPQAPVPQATSTSDDGSLKHHKKSATSEQQQQAPVKVAVQTHQKAKPEDTLSPLHKAAKAASASKVRELLEDGADPCALDGSGRTPFQLADDKETRNVFRRFMAEHPDRWDYQASQIPSALTPEMEGAQEAKKAEKKAKQRERERARKAAADDSKRAVAVSRAEAVEDEVARAALEAATQANKCASLTSPDRWFLFS